MVGAASMVFVLLVPACHAWQVSTGPTRRLGWQVSAVSGREAQQASGHPVVQPLKSIRQVRTADNVAGPRCHRSIDCIEAPHGGGWAGLACHRAARSTHASA